MNESGLNSSRQYSSLPLNRMTTTVEEREQKYSRLPQDTIRKVYAVYDKVFGPSFQGYYQHVIKIANRSNINQQVFTEVETEVNEAT